MCAAVGLSQLDLRHRRIFVIPRVESLGPLIVGIAGDVLSQDEQEVLLHPGVGGVILFAHNYRCRAQLRALCDDIRGLRQPPLLIAADQEGGRVQRFREGFSALPAAAQYGILYDDNPDQARRAARAAGRVMATELRAGGVDFSFAPVLDLGRHNNAAGGGIGDRAWHRDPDAVTALAHQFLSGMRDTGVSGVGKHFPGHGGVALDSHDALPIDRRAYEDIRRTDLIPFERLIASGLEGVMPAHVVFEDVDSCPAGFSYRWINDVLRGELGFQKIVFSDDLDMAAAAVGGDHVDRARAALDAGCDMVLACNDWQAAVTVVDGVKTEADPVRTARIAGMYGRGAMTFEQLASDAAYQSAIITVKSFVQQSRPDDDRGG